jgi:hypothetical protein
MALKPTIGKAGDSDKSEAYSDPYRLYNLDVFEYELDEPMALCVRRADCVYLPRRVGIVLEHAAARRFGGLGVCVYFCLAHVFVRLALR